ADYLTPNLKEASAAAGKAAGAANTRGIASAPAPARQALITFRLCIISSPKFTNCVHGVTTRFWIP
ncbi:MAG TPA: hypothetical protein PLI17_14290, partial [Denitromonas sp.]|nr:hypothetical protein [Denitromonas sp.]